MKRGKTTAKASKNNNRKMSKLPFRKLKPAKRSQSQKPLIGNIKHEDSHHDPHRWLVQVEAENLHNAALDRPLQSDVTPALHQILGVTPQADPSESGCHHGAADRCSVLMQTFWRQTIAPPAEVTEQNLHLHLAQLQEVVLHQLAVLRPRLQPLGLMGPLVACCRRRVAAHLQGVLQSVASSRSCFRLVLWARQQQLSYEEFSGGECQTINEWDEWETKARVKLLQQVEKEIKVQHENILQNHKEQKTCTTEEAYVELHVDVIQCTFAMPEQAKSIDEELSDQVRQVCSQELQTFVKGYHVWQRDFLEQQATMKQPQTIHFLKTLKTCKELRKHIQEDKMEETVAMLDELETFTKDVLTRRVIGDVEENLKRYFKQENTRVFPFAALEEHFPCLPFVEDEHKAVMGDVYKGAAHLYFKRLIGTSRRKLRRWSGDVGATVHDDAMQLHRIVSARASDVYEYNKMLLSIPEVLDSNNNPGSLDSMKMTVARIKMECDKQSEDVQLLPALLLWRGLPHRHVRIVMEALPGHSPTPTSRFRLFGSCWGCCCC